MRSVSSRDIRTRFAGHEPSRLRQGRGGRRRNPARGGGGNAVTIEKDAVVAPARQHRAIARLAGAEAAVLLPDMPEANTDVGRPAADQRARVRGPEAIIRNQDLKFAVGLSRQAPQDSIKRVLALVGGENDGDLPGHQRLYGSSLPPAGRCSALAGIGKAGTTARFPKRFPSGAVRLVEDAFGVSGGL